MNDTSAPQAWALHILWGANPEDDLPATFTFSTEAAQAAFLKGVNEADGWMDVKWLDHARYKIDRAGELVEMKGARSPGAAHEVFAMWGEDPEPGTRPSTYAFDTAEEAQAFKQGADAAAGWTTWKVVPSANHRLVGDTDLLRDPVEYPWLNEKGRQHLVNLLDRDDLPAVIFATPEGRWTDEDGVEGEAPSILPVRPAGARPRR